MPGRTSFSVMVLLGALVACDGSGAGKGEVASAPSRERTIVPVRWHRAWTAGGTEGDTTLLQPWRLATGREHVYVADKAGRRVAAFSLADGSLAWIRGREGSGPGEFQLPTAIAVDRAGVLWVADATSRRLTLYQPDGTLERSIPLPDLPYPEAICPTADGMMVATNAAEDPLFRISGTGAIVGRSPLPWPDLADAPPLSVQKFFAAQGDGCVLALVLGRGFATMSGSVARTYAYLDQPDLPEIEKTVENKGNTVSERVLDMRIAATSVSATGEEIAISPGGAGPLENRLIDFYRSSDGQYLRSYTTPVPFQQMAIVGDIFLFLTFQDGYPALVAVRPAVERTQGDSSSSR